MKYIMFSVDIGGTKRKVPIIFPDTLVHSLVNAVMRPCLQEHFKKAKIEAINAGEYNIATGETHGKSETLHLSADEDDGTVIACYDYLHGIMI